ncbi:cbb3-type cytochrome oxidase assembly protein CcoS [Paracoccus sp. SCSIO 75233]|uniref:cbb3-type cytochrome oxidase assembly protein CcoS n=1 Tax=Paracoccus sp. SCSIO 75233 TaxID=3017782 RepID=UPI0022F0FDFF|nr:cbb3-type cytochrome oxidase assembly protein CcoS [Paracoccus sp. SCSIO 75233]WBU54001.1 cbb3-type cytochrome oxidase assembly protein CcoS [Paracoccus sp. SCSIO 75233]
MSYFFLIPITLFMGSVGLLAFFWSLRTGQYEDLTGDAQRILFDDDDRPLPSGLPPEKKEPRQ